MQTGRGLSEGQARGLVHSDLFWLNPGRVIPELFDPQWPTTMASGDKELEVQDVLDVDTGVPEAMSPPRQAMWDLVQQWLNDTSPETLYASLEQLENNREYTSWLKTELAIDDHSSAVQRTVGSTGSTDITQLSAHPGRAFGYRIVSVHGLQKKMRDIFIAGEWRAWDVAKLCLVDSLKEPAQKKTEQGCFGPGCSSRGRASCLPRFPPPRLRIARVVRLSSQMWHSPSNLVEESRNKYPV